jgi:type III secretion protein D
MNAHSPSSQADLLVLRVIEGRQAGAEYRLAAGLSVTVGHGFHHDIVLRMPADKDVSIRLELNGGVIALNMVAGNASLLGRPLAAGDSAQLPYYVPLVIGAVSFAIGSPDSERWAEAAQLRATPEMATEVDAESTVAGVSQLAAPHAPAAGLAGQAQGMLQVLKQALAPVGEAIGMERRWPIYAVIGATALIAVLLFNPISNWVGHEYFGAPAAQQILRDAGYQDVTVRDTPEGGLLVKGLVQNDAQLTRLRKLISEKQPAALIDVHTLDGLAAGVTDLLVAQGIDAEAKAGRGKTLIIDSEYLPGDRQEELAQQIRKDVPALAKVIFNVNPERGEPMLQYFFSSEKYGIASFVDGDPAYISTANGDKWFKGAPVPTGHVIVEIGNGRVRFERNGRIEELSFTSEDANASEVDEATGGSESKVAETKERKTL